MQLTPTIYVIKIVKPQNKKILSNMRLCNIRNKCDQNRKTSLPQIFIEKSMWPTFLHTIEIEKSKFPFLGNMQQSPTIYMQL